MVNVEWSAPGRDIPQACPSPMVREPLEAEAAVGLARMFKALSDPVRLRLLSLIASDEDGESCVCDLTDAFEVSQPTISHHLRVLREAGLVGTERRGTWVYYRVLPTALAGLSSLLEPPAGAGGQLGPGLVRSPAAGPALYQAS